MLRILWLLLLIALPGHAQTFEEKMPEKPPGWWQKSDLIDYGIITASLGLFGVLHLVKPLDSSGIGPSFDEAHPSRILDPSLGMTLGKPYLVENKQETVPALWVGLAIPVVGTWLGLQEGLTPGRDARHLHDTLVGFAETMAGTLLVTEALKFSFGRLRPDFQDRTKRYYCNRSDHADIDCTGFSEGPLADSASSIESIWADGRRSFPSGHSSTSFALATYAALVTGGHFVWGKDSSSTTRIWGIPIQTALLGLASFVAWSRVDDGRHNISDVLTGSAIGIAVANVAYWRRFSTDGVSRKSKFSDRVSLTGGPTSVGIGLSLTF